MTVASYIEIEGAQKGEGVFANGKARSLIGTEGGESREYWLPTSFSLPSPPSVISSHVALCSSEAKSG